MELDEAYKIAISDKRVREMVKKGFYLSSAFVNQDNAESVGEWNLIFFNPNSGNVFSVKVGDSGISVSDVQRPLKEGFYKEMSTKGKGDIEDILKIVRSEFSSQIAKLLINVREDSWDILIIGKNLKTLYLKIDAGTKRVVEKEKGSLLKG